MANRLNTFPTFANLAPPWSLPTLDNNFVTINSFANDSSLGYVNFGTDSGTAGNYNVTLAYGTPSAYNHGMTVSFIPLNSNTGSSSITVNPLGSVSILSPSGGTLPPNTIQAGVLTTLIFSQTAFRPIAGTPNNPFNDSLGMIAAPATTTINCSGYTSVNVKATLGTGGLYTFSLTNLALGVLVSLNLDTNGTNKHITVVATNPSATSYTSFGISNGSGVDFSTGGFTDAPSTMLLVGTSMFDSNTSLPVLYLGINYF